VALQADHRALFGAGQELLLARGVAQAERHVHERSIVFHRDRRLVCGLVPVEREVLDVLERRERRIDRERRMRYQANTRKVIVLAGLAIISILVALSAIVFSVFNLIHWD
jgi:hypothetical protein